MLGRLLDRVPGFGKTGRLVLTKEQQPVRKSSRLLSDGKAIRLSFGGQDLELYPERKLTTDRKSGNGAWLLAAPQQPLSVISGFARIEPGKNLLVGRESEALNGLFSFPRSVARRHLIIDNENGQIVINPLDMERGVQVSLTEEEGESDGYMATGRTNLKRLREILGGPIGLLPPDEALACLEEVLVLLGDEAYRPKDDRKRPGGLLDLPAKPTPVLLGDLHAQIDILLKVLSLDNHLGALESGEAYLLMLGDVVHREGDGELQEMDSSLMMLDFILRLKKHFPSSVFCLRGNHESFDEDVGKGGVPQGLLLRERAKALRGQAYADRLATYFEALPYFARSPDFIACHAGAPTRKATPQKLINLWDHPKLARELMWNRLAGPNRPGGYGKKDVKQLRELLERPKKLPFLVSHTPLSREGTFWPNVGNIKGHHVLYSARPARFALYTRVGQEMTALEYAGEPLLDYFNNLD